MLSEDADVDLVKLAQFAVKYQLPNSLRVSIWKLLLGAEFQFFHSLLIFSCKTK